MANKNCPLRCNYRLESGKECGTRFKFMPNLHDHWMRHMAKDPEVLAAQKELHEAAHGLPTGPVCPTGHQGPQGK